jgi:hypothetical protein
MEIQLESERESHRLWKESAERKIEEFDQVKAEIEEENNLLQNEIGTMSQSRLTY